MRGAILHRLLRVVELQESIDQALQKISPPDKFVDRIAGYRVDTGSEAEVAEGLKDAVSKFGSLQILINAVGGGRGKAPLVETDMAQFESVLKLNLTAGLMSPTKVVAAYWIANGISSRSYPYDSRFSYRLCMASMLASRRER